MSIEEIIFQLGFKVSHDVEGRLTIADLFRNTKARCGIYLLVLNNNLFYIGSSNNVVRRFREHKVRHNNISKLYFQPTKFSLRKTIETEIINKAESCGIPLINVIGITNIASETDLDELISPDDQENWINGSNIQLLKESEDRPFDDKQRLRFKHKFDLFQNYPNYEQIIQVLRLYVQKCIPSFRNTEKAFWSISCIPSTNKDSWPRLACISMNAMETIVIGHHLNSAETNWSFLNISEKVFRQKFFTNKSFYDKHPQGELRAINYHAAGSDQISINFESLQNLKELLSDNVIIQAARTLNLRLMRKGASRYAQYHCFSLADLLVEPSTLYPRNQTLIKR